MSGEQDLILKKLDILAEKLDVLTIVMMLKGQAKKVLEGKKSQKEQIQVLKKWKLSNEIIALVLGTTPDVISVRSSEMKSNKSRKEKQNTQEEKIESQ
jgi:hypothetical protein